MYCTMDGYEVFISEICDEISFRLIISKCPFQILKSCFFIATFSLLLTMHLAKYVIFKASDNSIVNVTVYGEFVATVI